MASDKPAPHYYGGQALMEGVMMRGRDTWAVAVRRPTNEIYLETHPVRSLAHRSAIWRKPLFRGVAAMGEALSIGMRAMMISTNQSLEEQEKLTKKQMAMTLSFALVAFIAIFIVGPNLLGNIGNRRGDNSILVHAKEGAIRLGVFLGYMIAISFVKEIRRVFQYHGAEHKTIAAYEAKEPSLTPEVVDRYSTIHVRCGTNFLIITMLLTIVLFTFADAALADAEGNRPAIWVQVLERIGGIFVIAGISYEGLRLGAAQLGNPVVRALMKPGLWLQKITTRQPEPAMIEVAIRSFEQVLPEEERSIIGSLPSPTVRGDSLADEDAQIRDEVQALRAEVDAAREADGAPSDDPQTP